MIIIPPEIFRILADALLSRPRPVEFAKERLRAIIAADRVAVPCGRWVPHVAGEFYPGRKGSLPFKVKPRWRLQWR